MPCLTPVPPPGFVADTARDSLLVRAEVRQWLAPLLRTRGDWAGYDAHPLAGGRGGTCRVRVDGHEVVVRPYRRGGWVARVLYDTYLGRHPRPFRELQALVALRQAGVPVVEVYGAAVHWLAPGVYRGWLATRYVTGATTLWEWLAAAPPAAERAAVLATAGRAVRRLHDSGWRHPDLNLTNILVAPGPVGLPDVLLIDFDRACQGTRRAGHDLLRLERSARKLDPPGTTVTAADLAALRAAYAAGASCR